MKISRLPTELWKSISLYVLFIPAVKSVEDELKFGRNTVTQLLTSDLFLPIIEKTSEEKA